MIDTAFLEWTLKSDGVSVGVSLDSFFIGWLANHVESISRCSCLAISQEVPRGVSCHKNVRSWIIHKTKIPNIDEQPTVRRPAKTFQSWLTPARSCSGFVTPTRRFFFFHELIVNLEWSIKTWLHKFTKRFKDFNIVIPQDSPLITSAVNAANHFK